MDEYLERGTMEGIHDVCHFIISNYKTRDIPIYVYVALKTLTLLTLRPHRV